MAHRDIRKEKGGDKKKIAWKNIIKRHHAAATKLRAGMSSMASCCHKFTRMQPFIQEGVGVGRIDTDLLSATPQHVAASRIRLSQQLCEGF